MKKGLTLRNLLTMVFILMLLMMASLFYGLTLYQHSQLIRRQQEELLLSVGRQLALDPQIKTALLTKDKDERAEVYTKKIAAIHRLDFVVVMDMRGIRLTHPDKSKIGKHFEGGDERPALKGKTVISVSQGSLGKSLRGFVPIYADNAKKKQIGVVALGIKVHSLSTLIRTSRQGYSLALFLSIMVGFAAATGLAFYLKRQLLNLEPRELSRLFEERNAMLDQTKDAIVVIDLGYKISLANIAAEELYRKSSGQNDSLLQKPVEQLITDFSADMLKDKKEQVYRQKGQDYIFSSAPIEVSGKLIGWIIFLRNATESFLIMDQLANTTAYASSLQAQTHEFVNRLHVIYGLADLNAYEELKIYLEDILTPDKEFAHQLSFLVQNPQIAGFLNGERQKFTERKIPFLVEISPKIPANENEAETKALINVYRYIHHVLLQLVLQGNLSLAIHYEDNQLTARYFLTLPQDQQEQLQNQFDNHFFKQILKENQAEFDMQAEGGLIQLVLVLPYKEGNT
ncbi:Spo0B domain-containing protein [Streptococcus caviae]|uniref:Spo0B domain-containing protein n=1 Tax=Streptococcus sp. 'caviae' TaxID=1915004 RepID=UPI00094B81D4|nr:sensor histidine kinase [Streptococcus sp. 'caviae']OLN82774.1 histidine kinase [Streptococcus sp. 'caviae']